MEIKELEINQTINFTDEGIKFTLTRVDEEEYDINMESEDDEEFATTDSLENAIYIMNDFIYENS